VLLRGDGGAGLQVVPVGGARRGGGGEDEVRVEALGAGGGPLGAGPRDARAAGEFGVAQAAVVTRPAAGALLPVLEGALGVLPLHQGLAVPVPEAHAPGEV